MGATLANTYFIRSGLPYGELEQYTPVTFHVSGARPLVIVSHELGEDIKSYEKMYEGKAEVIHLRKGQNPIDAIKIAFEARKKKGEAVGDLVLDFHGGSGNISDGYKRYDIVKLMKELGAYRDKNQNEPFFTSFILGSCFPLAGKLPSELQEVFDVQRDILRVPMFAAGSFSTVEGTDWNNNNGSLTSGLYFKIENGQAYLDRNFIRDMDKLKLQLVSGIIQFPNLSSIRLTALAERNSVSRDGGNLESAEENLKLGQTIGEQAEWLRKHKDEKSQETQQHMAQYFDAIKKLAEKSKENDPSFEVAPFLAKISLPQVYLNRIDASFVGQGGKQQESIHDAINFYFGPYARTSLDEMGVVHDFNAGDYVRGVLTVADKSLRGYALGEIAAKLKSFGDVLKEGQFDPANPEHKNALDIASKMIDFIRYHQRNNKELERVKSDPAYKSFEQAVENLEKEFIKVISQHNSPNSKYQWNDIEQIMKKIMDSGSSPGLDKAMLEACKTTDKEVDPGLIKDILRHQIGDANNHSDATSAQIVGAMLQFAGEANNRVLKLKLLGEAFLEAKDNGNLKYKVSEKMKELIGAIPEDLRETALKEVKDYYNNFPEVKEAFDMASKKGTKSGAGSQIAPEKKPAAAQPTP